MVPRKTEQSEPKLCLVKGSPCIRIPAVTLPADADPVMRIRHSGGIREMGRLEPGRNRPRTVELVGVQILDGFMLEIAGETAFQLFPTDMLVFSGEEEIPDSPGRGTVILRDRGSSAMPDGMRAVSVGRWGSMEIVSVAPAPAEPAPVRIQEPEPADAPEPDDAWDELEPAVQEVPDEPVPAPQAGSRVMRGEPRTFAGGEPSMVLRESGIVRRFCVDLPPYVPAGEDPAAVRIVYGGARADAGIPDDRSWIFDGAEIDLASCGVPHNMPFEVEVDGRRVYSSPGGNVMYFSQSGVQLTVPRGRVVAVHPSRIKLGVSGGAKVRVLSTDTQGDWVFETMELGARGKVYIDVPSYWEQRRQGILRSRPRSGREPRNPRVFYDILK